MKMLTLKETQERVDSWIEQFGGGYWSPLSMFASLVEEVGELGREINNLWGCKTKKTCTHNLDMELADIIFSLICIANYFEVDLEDALIKTLVKYSERDSTRWISSARGDR